jgi:hypothetical protein
VVTRKVVAGWFPEGELEKAVALWPELIEGWDVHSYSDYCKAVDEHLRALDLGNDVEVSLAPIEVRRFIRWCSKVGADPSASTSRSKYATTMAARRRVRAWPPGPGQGCWCGKDLPYAECCGSPL